MPSDVAYDGVEGSLKARGRHVDVANLRRKLRHHGRAILHTVRGLGDIPHREFQGDDE